MNILVDGQTFMSPEINRGIGIYLKNTLNNMVKQSYEDVWYIAVANVKCLDCLDPWVRQHVQPIVDDIFMPSTDYKNKTDLYTCRIKKIVSTYNIDCYWNPNPMMVNVLFPNDDLSCRMYLTIHDLIPLIMPINSWDYIVKAEYNRRVEFLNNERINLLCNSYATQNDVYKNISNNINSKVTHLAADTRLFYKCVVHDGINTNPIMVFTGGFDYRKNLKGAIDSFIALKIKYKDNKYVNNIKFYIVCKYQEYDKQILVKYLKKYNLENDVVFTGFISDKELAELYQSADLFFFPSHYEGFGLPLLEAMLSGCLILSANNSSLPEVCGDNAIYFDSDDIAMMADTIFKGIEKVSKEDRYAKRQRQEYALQFTWERTSMLTLEEFHNDEMSALDKMKIAVVTPWPEQKTGIANFEYMLMPYLSEYFDIDIYINDNLTLENIKEFKYGNIYNFNKLNERKDKYNRIIYQIGNNVEFHKDIYLKLKECGGIAEIHDYVLNPFFYHAFFLKGNKEEYRYALEEGYGTEGIKQFRGIEMGTLYPDNNMFPMAHSIANISIATIVHNNWMKNQLDNCGTVVTIPLASFDKKNISKRGFTEQVIKNVGKIERDCIIIGCFGFVNLNKRPQVLVNVVNRLLGEGYEIKLIFWGKSNIVDLDAKYGSENIAISGYLIDSDYEKAMEVTDIVVNLRYPSMGESSGTLCEAFKYGKPVIVSDINQYQEFPDEVCWKVPVNEFEETLLYEMLKYLIMNKEVRLALGKNAKNYADRVLDPKRIAYQYYRFLKNIGGDI